MTRAVFTDQANKMRGGMAAMQNEYRNLAAGQITGFAVPQPGPPQVPPQQDTTSVDMLQPSPNAGIAPRLRVEDLKPPPAKRQKQMPKSKDDKLTVKKQEEESPVNAAPSPSNKRPPPKKNAAGRRKPSMAGMAGMQSEPIDVDAMDTATTPVAVVNDITVEVASPKPNIVQAIAKPELPVEVQVMRARQQEEAQAREDPIAFLNKTWNRLVPYLGQVDMDVLDNIAADLDVPSSIPFDDSFAELYNQRQHAPVFREPVQPPPLAQGFDYSSYIDLSGLDGPDEMSVVAPTPDLLHNGDPRCEVSPSDDGIAATPKHPLDQKRVGVVSPKRQNSSSESLIFGEDGWLTDVPGGLKLNGQFSMKDW